jgi:hypothetical protein
MVRQLIVIALVTVLGACTRTSEKYCGLHPEDLANCPRSDAPRQACTTDPECPAMAPHCLLEGGGGECVECIDDADCTSTGKLACDPDTRSCRSCVEHTDCPDSLTCLPEGTCGTDADVIYVTAGGANAGTCGGAAPCGTVAYALGQVSATRYHLKLSGALAETVVIEALRVVMLADPGTTLTGADPSIKIIKGTVSIYDLEIACSPNGAGIKSEMGSTTLLRDLYVHGCGGKGPAIEAKGGFIGINRVRVGESRTGGISTDGSAVFSITNTIVYRNGSPMSAKGGVTIGAATVGMNNRFEHNTVVFNQAKTAVNAAGGVGCTVTNVLEMPYNIIAGNTTSMGVGDNTIGACDFSKSSVVADPTEFAFVSSDAPYDYHILAGSSAIDRVEVSTVSDDADGQFRPQGPRKDLGADEYKP